MKKLKLKEMEQIANEYGCDATYIFNHGLHSLLSSREALKADRKNPIKYQIDRIINDLDDIQIAENVLREWYGIMFCSVSNDNSRQKLHLYCGIDEVAEALGVNPKETNEWQLEKEFKYQWADFVQLAERNSTKYLKAFEPNGKLSHYSTTYEKAYGKENGDEV